MFKYYGHYMLICKISNTFILRFFLKKVINQNPHNYFTIFLKNFYNCLSVFNLI